MDEIRDCLEIENLQLRNTVCAQAAIISRLKWQIADLENEIDGLQNELASPRRRSLTRAAQCGRWYA